MAPSAIGYYRPALSRRSSARRPWFNTCPGLTEQPLTALIAVLAGHIPRLTGYAPFLVRRTVKHAEQARTARFEAAVDVFRHARHADAVPHLVAEVSAAALAHGSAIVSPRGAA